MIYGTNKEKTFKNIEEYKSVLAAYSIPVDNLFYVDSASYDSYMYDLVIGQKLDYLVGIFINDSTQFEKTGPQAPNVSCPNWVRQQVENADTSHALQRRRILGDYEFYQLGTRNRTAIKFIDKKKVVLAFSYLRGRLSKSDFKEIEEKVLALPDYELCVLCMDNIASLR